MRERERDLAPENAVGTVLGVEEGDCIALIGSGGKTTTMMSLAWWAQSAGLRTLITTTTKIWPPEGVVTYYGSPDGDLLHFVAHGLRVRALVAAGARKGPEGKVHGLMPDAVDVLRRSGLADVILVEADGAASRPLKAHRAGEPVVPASCSRVLLMAGLDAVGQVVGRGAVHRVDEFCRLTGATPDTVIGAEQVARALLAMIGHVPAGAEPAFLLNKADGEPAAAAAREIAGQLLAAAPDTRCLATSHGRVVAVYR